MTTINGKVIIRSELDISPATILEIEQTLNNEIAIIINERYKAMLRVHLEYNEIDHIKSSMPDMIIIDDPTKEELTEEQKEHMEQLYNISRQSNTIKGGKV